MLLKYLSVYLLIYLMEKETIYRLKSYEDNVIYTQEKHGKYVLLLTNELNKVIRIN